jgi:hypothetical protein
MIVVYGNCQAGVYADLLRKICAPGLQVHYVMSFDHPTELQAELPNEALEKCTLFLQQVEVNKSTRFTPSLYLSPRAQIVHFVPLDFNLLWPFNFTDPRNVGEPPDFPFGRFPYGDRIVVELLREGLSGDALWQAYCARSVIKLPDLARLEALEQKRLEARETNTTHSIASYIMSEFRNQRLFWTINHPSSALLAKQFSDILSVSNKTLNIPGDVRELAAKFFHNYEPFDHNHVPIHPDVARRLQLAWWSPTLKYRYLDGSMLTFEETMRNYINFRPLS